MKIVLIRHAQVNYKWKFWYNSESFNKACHEYDTSEINVLKKYKIETSDKIYISELSRTYDTAKLIFGESEFVKMSLFNEVPLSAFTKKSLLLPIIIWNVFGRIQWYVNSKKQLETRNQTYERAKKTIDFLEEKNADCFIVCHGFYMRVLLNELKLRGYTGDYLKRGVGNLQKFTLSNIVGEW